jgi:hypothetical protein
MVQKNKYWKTLAGFFFEALVGKAVAYTTQATYTLFVANAAEGEIGIYNADTFALYDGLSAAGASDNIFVALKRDGNVEKTMKFSNATYTKKRIASAAAVAQISDVVTIGTPVAGQEYAVKIIETTIGSQPYPSWYYSYVATASDTLTTIATKIRDLINDTTNVINKDTDPIVTAALTATDDIRLTAKNNATFRIAFSHDAFALGWTSNYTEAGTANNSFGNGTYAQVAELEEQALIYKGVTTNYPGTESSAANASDFGKPTAFATVGVSYNIYFISGDKTENSPTPKEKHFQAHSIILAIPTASGPETAVKAILGL